MRSVVSVFLALAFGTFVNDASAQTYDFALACTFRGGLSNFVVSGNYVKGEATISRADGTLAKSFVRFDFNTAPQPKLAILLKGLGRLGEWRDLYVIDTAVGTFTHVTEQYVDGTDKEPFMAVQGGTCAATGPVGSR